ncbi:hypothetical protein [Bacillus atrophaeus]|jgi:hypothetical protein|nr:hypothetical protein [Bacillus atrophaeus]AKL86895.1 hypothetical protein D068_cds41140 [Bacillus atrophaeus UCMB-5137]ARW08843.1 hypothetical protein S101359_03865 [Bacillus atrophaeus]MDQ0929805.1 hypothetical protein [Bacillus atrophaeus]MDS9995614.1 hypothetical protein [Bacillus atrophaeus]MEC0651117.1 hypothetical protein [Bacillus atrophaeus]
MTRGTVAKDLKKKMIIAKTFKMKTKGNPFKKIRRLFKRLF